MIINPEIQVALNKMRTHGFILAFILQTPVEHPLCARPCSRHRGNSCEGDTQDPQPCEFRVTRKPEQLVAAQGDAPFYSHAPVTLASVRSQLGLPLA